MDIARKLDLVRQSILSITTHEDVDAAVRHAALKRIEEFIRSEQMAINRRVDEAIADHLTAEAPKK